MKPLVDKVETKEKVRILLMKGGRRVAGIHLEDGKEFRSPSLEQGSSDAPKKR